jgi:hypothetical protein
MEVINPKTEKYKTEKYIHKIEENIFDPSTKTYIIKRSKELAYILDFLNNKNPTQLANVDGPFTIFLEAKNEIYNLSSYLNTFIRSNNTTQELLLDDIISMYKNNTPANGFDFTAPKYADLIDIQIIVGLFYIDDIVRKKLKLKNIDFINKFTRNIVKITHSVIRDIIV